METKKAIRKTMVEFDEVGKKLSAIDHSDPRKLEIQDVVNMITLVDERLFLAKRIDTLLYNYWNNWVRRKQTLALVKNMENQKELCVKLLIALNKEKQNA